MNTLHPQCLFNAINFNEQASLQRAHINANNYQTIMSRVCLRVNLDGRVDRSAWFVEM